MAETTVAALEDRVIRALQTVVDPELDVDLVNLGLIYGVTMTLTTMSCPISAVLQQMIESALKKITEIKAVQIKLVWSPAWTPARMSRYAKIALGYHG